jgi:hypothetical protein
LQLINTVFKVPNATSTGVCSLSALRLRVLIQRGQSAVDIGFTSTQQNQLETEGHRKAAVAENNADARI